MNKLKKFPHDFILVVIGQIISLFGNNVLRFALPLYLLNKTHSASLFGIVSACSFVPMILLSPIGGIIADRINKRNIMVILDFCTAIMTVIFTFLLGSVNLVILIIFTLIILYGIQGAYQPSVQASIPALVSPEQIIPANSIVTLVNSLASLLGPVIGGAVYGFYGLKPVLIVSIICFFVSAVMELFIHIPFEKKQCTGSVFSIAKNDLKESIFFIKNKKTIIGKIALYIAAINFFFSALLIIGLPIIITQKLGFNESIGNQLYGYCEGAMAAGGLFGGLLAGTLSKKLNIHNSHILLFACSLLLMPIGLAMLFQFTPMISYGIIIICCFITMTASTVFSIEMISYVQIITPSELIGKIMALAMCICMFASPLGQALYGILFETMTNKPYVIFFSASLISCIIALISRKSFKNLPNALPNDFAISK